MPRTEGREAVLKVLFGLQELLFTLIRGLLYVLPIGILAFAGSIICTNRSRGHRWCIM